MIRILTHLSLSPVLLGLSLGAQEVDGSDAHVVNSDPKTLSLMILNEDGLPKLSVESGEESDGPRITVTPVVGELQVSAIHEGTGVEIDSVGSEQNSFRMEFPGDGTRVEVATMDFAGAYRFTFPESKLCHVLLDISNGSPEFRGGELRMRDDKTFEGYGLFVDERGNERKVFYSFHFSMPFRERGIWTGDEVKQRHHATLEGNEPFGAYSFFWTRFDEQSILMKVGVSETSLLDARENVLSALPGWDFSGLF